MPFSEGSGTETVSQLTEADRKKTDQLKKTLIMDQCISHFSFFFPSLSNIKISSLAFFHFIDNYLTFRN